MSEQKLRMWWIPQVPMKSFHVDVSSVEEGIKLLDTLAEYDLFQYYNNVKPDYCNAGGLQMFDPKDDTDGPDGSWVDWYFESDGEYYDDPKDYVHDLQYMPDEKPTIINEILDELNRAITKFPTWPTDPLHASAILGEEAGELDKALLEYIYEGKGSIREIRKEAIQTAAMAIRFLNSIGVYEYTRSKQHTQSPLRTD